MSRKFKEGDLIAYRFKDLHGYQLIIGTVQGYLAKTGPYKDWLNLITIDGVAVIIAEHVPVLIPTVWADTLTPVKERAK